jgi:hypothetical protein
VTSALIVAKESLGDEIRVLKRGRKAALGGGREHVGEDVEVVTVKQHTGTDQPEDSVVE